MKFTPQAVIWTNIYMIYIFDMILVVIYENENKWYFDFTQIRLFQSPVTFDHIEVSLHNSDENDSPDSAFNDYIHDIYIWCGFRLNLWEWKWVILRFCINWWSTQKHKKYNWNSSFGHYKCKIVVLERIVVELCSRIGLFYVIFQNIFILHFI